MEDGQTIQWQKKRTKGQTMIHKTLHRQLVTPVGIVLRMPLGGIMSYLRYLCLFAHSGMQCIFWCVFVLFLFVLCALCCRFLWIVHFMIASSVFSNVFSIRSFSAFLCFCCLRCVTISLGILLKNIIYYTWFLKRRK